VSSGRERGLGERPEGEEVGQVSPPVMMGTDELPLFRGLGRGLPQEVIGKSKKEVSLDDSFCFECKRCGDCCFRCEIVLTPYDILRLGADSSPGMLRRCVGETKAHTPDPFPPWSKGVGFLRKPSASSASAIHVC